MKITTNNGLYIQKKDLELIFKATGDVVPDNVVKQYKLNCNIKDIDFIFFVTEEEINFLNKFWFVIDYNDIIDFDFIEILDFYDKDLNHLRKMRIDYERGKLLPKKNVYNDYFEMISDQMEYFNHIPNKNEAKKYPLDFQLLYNKVSDVMELNYFKDHGSDLILPDDVFKPAIYSKKQLQQIYYEVLSESLTFPELKPYEKQLYLIFSKINYTPDIIYIIRKIMIINRYNTIDFINEDLLDLVLRMVGKKGKFEGFAFSLIDYLYVIGYNKFENFDSKIILEKDIKIIKKIIDYISRENLEDKYIDKLAKYNNVLAQIIRTTKQCNVSSHNSEVIREVFYNMLTFVYFKPNIINGDFEFLSDVYSYLIKNELKITLIMGPNLGVKDVHNEHFVENFNRSNGLLLYLYKEKYNKVEKKEICSFEGVGFDNSEKQRT